MLGGLTSVLLRLRGKFGNRMLQFVDAAFQATVRHSSPFVVHELRHLLEGLLHGLVQVQLSLRSISLRHQVLQLALCALPIFAGSAC